MARLTTVFGAAGIGLLAYLIAQLGPGRIASQLRGLGPVLPAVLLLTAIRYPLKAAGWRLALPRKARPPWGESVSATITGDALGYLTWGGPFTGEPLRALLNRASTPVAAGIAAGAIERGMYNFTAALLVVAVSLILLAASQGFPFVVAVVGSGIAGTALVVVRHSRHVTDVTRVNQLAPTPIPGSAVVRGIARLLDTAVELWHERRNVLPWIAVLCLAQHAVLVGEAYILLNALGGPTTLRTACVFEAMTKIVNTVGMVVPGRVGVAEGGSAALAGALGFAASHGLSLAIMRRVRALFWGVVGLILLPLQEAKARKALLMTTAPELRRSCSDRKV